MKARWAIVALALAAATSFAMAVQGGRWWQVGEVSIGPFGSRHCFGGGCQRGGLGWVGADARWERIGIAVGAACLIAMLVLLVVAAAVAARRVPRLAAKTTLVAIATALVVGIAFVVQFPGIDGAGLGRGLGLYAAGVVLGLAAAIGVLRARPLPAST